VSVSVLEPIRKRVIKLEMTSFVRKPFNVEAVEITTENIEELAEFIGTVKYKEGSGQPYIHVDKRLVPNIYKVYPGFWMTRMNDNIRCYSRKIFMEQFVETTPEIQIWIDFLDGETEQEESAPVVGEYGRILEAPVAEEVVDGIVVRDPEPQNEAVELPQPEDVVDGQPQA